MHYVHSSLADEPALNKDERNPRKRAGVDSGSHGTNQLVQALYPESMSNTGVCTRAPDERSTTSPSGDRLLYPAVYEAVE